MTEREVDRLDHEDSDHDYLGIYLTQQERSLSGIGLGANLGTGLEIQSDVPAVQITIGKEFQVGSFDYDRAQSIEILSDSDLGLYLQGPEPPGMLSVDRPLTTIEDITIRKVVPGGGG